MQRIRNRLVRIGVVLLLALSVTVGASSRIAHADEQSLRFNDNYVFATTRGLNEMDMHPAFKATLLPVTIILDTVLLPFALIGGFIG